MSDDLNDKEFATEESEEDVIEESFSRLSPVKNRNRKISDLRHPRQKFCPKWEIDFPWLKADKIDESTGFCVVCNKHLVCKKSHLERHQSSFKHLRLSGCEVLDSRTEPKTEPSATEFMECGKREPEDYDEEFEQDAIEVDPDYNVEFELNPNQQKRSVYKHKKPKMPTKVQQQKEMFTVAATRGTELAKKKLTPKPAGVGNSSNNTRSTGVVHKLDRFKLLKRIDRDRHELNAFYARRQQLSPISGGIGMLPSRDSFDLFFDSVSASVKTLPPKLAAEVKSRVSQIIAEFELRAICEREALESSAAAAEPTVVVASTTHEMVASTNVTQEGGLGATAVPNIVYTFQPKLRD